jgi:hypothetical protein
MSAPEKTHEWHCCGASAQAHVADCGHTQGVEFTLIRCNNCHRHWMHLWFVTTSSGIYSRVDEAAVAQLIDMPAGKNGRRLLEAMFDL